MDCNEQMEIEDYLQEQGVFKNGISGKTAHCDSYMTIVDFENLEKALKAPYDWKAFREWVLDDSNTQIPMKIVCRFIGDPDLWKDPNL